MFKGSRGIDEIGKHLNGALGTSTHQTNNDNYLLQL